MTVITLPYTFTGGTRAIADQVDANFNAIVNSITTNVRTVLLTATTFYVSPTGSDTAGNGLSPSSPAATMTYIWNMLQNKYDLNNQTATIQLANGSYTEAVEILGTLPGQNSAAQIIFQGNVATPSLVTVTGNPYCFDVGNGGMCQIQGMTLQAPTLMCLSVDFFCHVNYQNLIFAAAGDCHVLSQRTAVVLGLGNYTISGAAPAHIKAILGGGVFLEQNVVADPPPLGQPTITITGTPAFSNAFMVADSCGVIRCGATFAGSATGVRSSATMNGVINIRGQGATYLPGSLAGTTATGGQTA